MHIKPQQHGERQANELSSHKMNRWQAEFEALSKKDGNSSKFVIVWLTFSMFKPYSHELFSFRISLDL